LLAQYSSDGIFDVARFEDDLMQGKLPGTLHDATDAARLKNATSTLIIVNTLDNAMNIDGSAEEQLFQFQQGFTEASTQSKLLTNSEGAIKLTYLELSKGLLSMAKLTSAASKAHTQREAKAAQQEKLDETEAAENRNEGNLGIS
jgi:flagellar biosynthesis component FlhA